MRHPKGANSQLLIFDPFKGLFFDKFCHKIFLKPYKINFPNIFINSNGIFVNPKQHFVKPTLIMIPICVLLQYTFALISISSIFPPLGWRKAKKILKKHLKLSKNEKNNAQLLCLYMCVRKRTGARQKPYKGEKN